MVTSSSGPGTPGAFSLSIPCSSAHDALATAAKLAALARDAHLSRPDALAAVGLVLDLAHQGIIAALREFERAQRPADRSGGEG